MITLREAEALLEVSHQKMTNLVKDGALQVFTSLLDKRKKLVRRVDVEQLRTVTEKAA